MNCLVGARPLVWLAEPGDVGVASPKQKRYAMRTVFVLARVDKKDAVSKIIIIYDIYRSFLEFYLPIQFRLQL